MSIMMTYRVISGSRVIFSIRFSKSGIVQAKSEALFKLERTDLCLLRCLSKRVYKGSKYKTLREYYYSYIL